VLFQMPPPWRTAVLADTTESHNSNALALDLSLDSGACRRHE
jgi:hypothetical protein